MRVSTHKEYTCTEWWIQAFLRLVHGATPGSTSDITKHQKVLVYILDNQGYSTITISVKTG